MEARVNTLAKRTKKDLISPEEEELKRFRYDFLCDYRNEAKWREQADLDGDFYDGNQWTEEEKQVLKERGQPAVTINRIKPRMDAIFGIQQALRVDTKAYPAHDKEQEAEAISERLREIEDDCDFDELETLVFEDQAIAGRGWFELKKEWDGLRSRHKIAHLDFREVVKDRYSKKPDLSDAKRVSKTVMTELEDAKALFPEFEEQIEACVDAKYFESYGQGSPHKNILGDQYKSGSVDAHYQDYNDFVDRERKRLRLVTMYYRGQTPQKYFYFPGEEPMDVTDMDEKSMETLAQAKPGGTVETQWKKTLNCVVFCWGQILEHKKDIRPHDVDAKFPLILTPGYIERKTGREYGLIRQMRDPQCEVNKRRSKLIHLITVNRVEYEKGAFEDPAKARAEYVKPDGFIERRQGFQVNVANNLELSQTHYMLLQQATQEIDQSAAGREVEGRSNSSSGREFQLRQQQATQPIRKLFSNLRAARRRVALYLLDEILREFPDLQTTKYDIVIEEAPESLNLNAETFETLVQLANNSKVPVPLDMLIKVSPLSGTIKKEFIERLQQQEQQQQALMAQQQEMMMQQQAAKAAGQQ